MILRPVLFCTLFSALIVAPVFSWAGAQDKLTKVETELDQQKQQAAALDVKAREASDALKDLQQKLVAATESLQAKSEEEERLEDKLDELTQEVDVKQRALKGEKVKLNDLTEALLELSRQPPASLFLQTTLTSDHIHRAILIRAIMPRLQEQTDSIAHDLSSLNDLQTKLAEQKDLVIAAQSNLEGQQHDLDQLVKTRQGLLQRTEEEKAAISLQLVSLASQAKNLHQLLEEVEPKHAPKSGHFSGLQSALKPPVAGSVSRNYGARDADGVTSEGLTYVALPGSPVVAPQAGKVLFTGPFRGYGQILILQHEGGYHSFLAGFGRIDVDVGEEVSAGEPLGVLPVKKDAKPELYFEWRYNNEAVDPTAGIALSKTRD